MGGSSYGVTVAGTQGTFQSCTCMSRWWPLLEDMCRKRGMSVPRVTQGSYRPATSYSAATHCGGGVVDLVTTGDWSALDTLMETMGAAAYERTPVDGFPRHSHVILTGCPHLDPSAQRQIAAWMDLRNGLVSNLPDRDTTRPPSWRTYAEGVEWARRQLTVTTFTPSRTSPEEDDMADINDMRVIDPYAVRPEDRSDRRVSAGRVLSDSARYSHGAVVAVRALADIVAAFILSERGADADLTKRVDAIAADLDALAAHLGNGGE